MEHVLVIGGGIAGVSTAYLLSKQGFRVTVVDKCMDVGCETSFLNGGLLCPSLSYPWSNTSAIPVALQSAFANDKNRQAIRLNPALISSALAWRWMGSFAWNMAPWKVASNHVASYNLCEYSLKCMKEEKDQGVLFTALGSLQVFGIEASALARKSVMDRMKNSKTEILNWLEIKQLVPVIETKVQYGVLSHGDTSGDVFKFTTSLKRLCDPDKVRFLPNTSIEGLEIKNKTILHAVTSTGSKMHADKYVVATGNGAPPLAVLAGDVLLSLPVKGYSVHVPVSEASLMYNVCDDIGKFYCSPVPGPAVRLSAFAEIGYSDTTPHPDRGTALIEMANDRFEPGFLLKEQAVVHACCRPQTPDDLPVIGPSANIKNLWYVTTSTSSFPNMN